VIRQRESARELNSGEFDFAFCENTVEVLGKMDAMGELADSNRERVRMDSILRRNLRLCLGEGLVAMPIIFLTLPGNFIVAMLLTQTFHLSESVFGLIVSLPAWCNVAQMIIVPVLGRIWSQKIITLIFSWLHLAVWVALALALPLIPMDDAKAAGRLFFLLFLLSSFFQAMVGVAWTSWVQEWIPARMRGKFFGMRNRALQLATVVFLLAGSWLLGWMQQRDPVLGFQIVVAISILLRALSIIWQRKILATSGYRAPEHGHRFFAQLGMVRRAPSMLAFIAFGAAFGFAANFLGPFFSVFLYEVLGASVGQVSLLIVIASVTGAVSLPAWGQLLDRYGNRPVLLFLMFPWMILGSLWSVVRPETYWLLYLIHASGGLFGAGFVLGSFNLLLKLIPPEAKTTAISLNVALTSLAAATAPILGGALLALAWKRGMDKMQTYHIAAIIHHGLLLSTVLILSRVREPKSSPLSQVIGAMRSYRQVGALLGLSFLVNYTFTKKRKRGSDQSFLFPPNPEGTENEEDKSES
jgi:MFS family permease